MDKSSAVEWLSSLTRKQFAEVFYAAAPKVAKHFDAYEGLESRLVLTLMSREKDDQGRWSDWNSLMICPVPREWDDDAPICQEGEHCGVATLSWDKRSTCPLCGGEVYGT